MPETETTIEVTITHKCGHVVTYRLPDPRPIYCRSDSQIAHVACDECTSEKKRPKAEVVPLEDGKYEVVLMRGSYGIRDTLFRRGYVYSPPRIDLADWSYWVWVRTVSADEIEAEVEWMRGNGWEA